MARPKKNEKKPDIAAEYTHAQVVDEDDENDAEETDADVEEMGGALPVPQALSDDEGVGGERLPAVASEGLPAALDPLKRYIHEISRYHLLTPEEELSLAMQLRTAGDMEAARRLVTANLRLVVKIAMEYRSAHANVMDLIQEGNVGLMKAVSKYDPSKGAKLSYYASWWIRSYILKYILDNFRLVKVGTTQAQKKLFYQLMREKERLEAQGLEGGPKLLADRLQVREKDVVEMSQRLSSRGAELSLQTPIDQSGDSSGSVTHQDFLVDSQVLPEERLALEQLIGVLEEHLPEFVKLLKEKELAVFQHRMAAEDPKTLQEVADMFGLTRERARQIESRVVEKLRDFYLERMK